MHICIYFSQANIHYRDRGEVALSLRFSEWFEMAASSPVPAEPDNDLPVDFRQVTLSCLFMHLLSLFWTNGHVTMWI